MKKILLVLGIGVASFAAVAQQQNGLERIIVEKYYISDENDQQCDEGELPAGSVTYRIYVDMLPGYKFQTCYGDENHEMRFETTTKFFNNEKRGNSTPTFTFDHAKKGTVLLDSYVTAGAACDGYYGIPKNLDNEIGTLVNSDGYLQASFDAAGNAISVKDGLLEADLNNYPMDVTTIGISTFLNVIKAQNATTNGQSLVVTNGAWAALGGAMGPTSENILLIAQFTTNGTFSYKLNVQIGNPNGYDAENYVVSDPIGDEKTIASLQGTYEPVAISKPTVSITSPSSGAKFKVGQSIQITANATDGDGTIAQVEFFVDGVSIGVDNTAPYSVNYTGVLGSKTITAVAKDNDDQTTTSIAVQITVEEETSVEEITNSDITVYPVYTNSTVEVTVPSASHIQYEIYSVLGVVVEKGIAHNSKFELDLSSLSSGQYIVKVIADSKSYLKRVVKK